MTDNAFAYTSRCGPSPPSRPGARHLSTRPYRPQTNGKAERSIQTCPRRWAYARPYRTSARGRALPAFRNPYNLSRPHRGLGNVHLLFAYLMRPGTTTSDLTASSWILVSVPKNRCCTQRPAAAPYSQCP